MKCPICNEPCDRESADVGVGVIYGPWGCPCGWSEDPKYDRSNGISPSQREHPNHYVDQWGNLMPHSAIKERLDYFGLDGERVINEVFKKPEPK